MTVCLALGGARTARAQNPPAWVTDPPPSTARVDFLVGSGTGATTRQAERAAYRHALGKQVAERPALVNQATREKIRARGLRRSEGTDRSVLTDSVVHRLDVDWTAVKTSGLRRVEASFARTPGGGHTAYVLFASPHRPEANGEVAQALRQLRARQRRAIRWRSLVPGWAQFHKGQSTKGLLFLAGEAALTGLFIAGVHGQMRLQERINGAPSGPRRRSYEEPKARLEALTWTGAVLAGALYIWNLVDGWTASSERFPLLSVEVKRAGVRRGGIQPTVAARSPGVRVTLALR